MGRKQRTRREEKAAAAPATTPTATWPLTWKEALLALVAGALLTVAVFGKSAHALLLQWDDTINLTENIFYRLPLGRAIAHFWAEPFFGLYIPVTYTSWALQVALARQPSGALDASVFHLANLVLHAINVALAYLLLRVLLGGEATARQRAAAAVGAGLFALHPLQVESVAWVSEHRGLLASALVLLAVLAWLRARLAAQRAPWYALAAVLYVAAALAKPSAVALPLALAVLDHGLSGAPLLTLARRTAPWLLVTIAVFVVTNAVQVPTTMNQIPPVALRPFVAGDALAFYGGHTAWPSGLCPDYGRTPEVVLVSGIAYVTTLLAVAVLVAAWRLRRRAPLVAVGVGWACAWLLPVLGLTPFVYQARSTVADRYAYLSLVGVALVVADLLRRGTDRWRVPAGALVVALLAARASQQVGIWASDEPFFRAMIACNPGSTVGYNNLARTLEQRGQKEEALVLYAKTLSIHPGDLVAITNRGAILIDQGKCSEAIPFIGTALDSVTPNANNKRSRTAMATNLGNCLLTTGKPDEAGRRYQQAVEADPLNAIAWHALGKVRLSQGRRAEARQAYARAVEIDPGKELYRRSLAEVEKP